MKCQYEIGANITNAWNGNASTRNHSCCSFGNKLNMAIGLTRDGWRFVQPILFHKTTVSWTQIAVQHENVPVMTRPPVPAKRQRAGALQDAPRIRRPQKIAPASWSAAALRRFSSGAGAWLRLELCTQRVPRITNILPELVLARPRSSSARISCRSGWRFSARNDTASLVRWGFWQSRRPRFFSPYRRCDSNC